MRQNADTVLVGRRCVLVPYEAKYVARYHAWMQNEELLRLTASERLTLDEEKSNQQSWRHDEKKLTFIILDAAHPRYVVGGGCGGVGAPQVFCVWWVWWCGFQSA